MLQRTFRYTVLSITGDDSNFFYTTVPEFRYGVNQDRLIGPGEHAFRHGISIRRKPTTQSGGYHDGPVLSFLYHD